MGQYDYIKVAWEDIGCRSHQLATQPEINLFISVCHSFLICQMECLGVLKLPALETRAPKEEEISGTLVLHPEQLRFFIWFLDKLSSLGGNGRVF